MSQRKQIARKTTGKHVEFTARFLASRATKRHTRSMTASAGPGGGGARSISMPAKSSPSAAVPLPASHSMNTSLSPADLNVPSPTTDDELTLTSRTGSLDTPISVYARFATWLETQKCVSDAVLLPAVERDGRQLFSLAKATVMFDNALRGNAHAPPAPLPPPHVNDVADGGNVSNSPLAEQAQTLRVFAQLLERKMLEGSLGEDLERAVLRDGEHLLQLATCCLDFDRAIRGLDET